MVFAYFKNYSLKEKVYLKETREKGSFSGKKQEILWNFPRVNLAIFRLKYVLVNNLSNLRPFLSSARFIC